MNKTFVCVTLLAASGAAYATVINTNNASTVAAFQSGATVVNFESISGITPQTITSYTAGNPTNATSYLFNQIPGVQFSVGGMVGVNEPAVYKLSGSTISGDANSPTNVLGPVDFDFTTKFNANGLIEIFFPTKVSRVGFWLNPALGNVQIIAADTNFAFSGLMETNLEVATVTAGNFVGVQRATADIGGFKIQALTTKGFTIDDFTFGGTSSTTPTPEPATMALLGGGLAVLGLVSRRRK